MSSFPERKLYSLVSELELFDHNALGKLVTRDASNLTFINWPNGAPCFSANLYMLSLTVRPNRMKRRGLARGGRKGGTIGEYAQKISQLVRFCYASNIDFIDLSDNDFTRFIHHLGTEVDPKNLREKRKATLTVVDVGTVCIDFLKYIGGLYEQPNFVAIGGRIKITESVTVKKDKRGRDYAVHSVWHHAFPPGGRRHERNAIPAIHIDQLRKAVDEMGGARFIKIRRHAFISTLENSGARLSEVASLKVADVLAAYQMKHPMLRFITLKGDDSEEREIPVNKMFLNELVSYIEFHRDKVVRNKFSSLNDHGFVFVSSSTGTPLSETSLGNEIGSVRRFAGIEEQACAHMFRHSFITNLVMEFVQRDRYRRAGDFEVRLLSDESYLEEVKMYTGQKSIATIMGYVHAAFKQIEGYSTTVSNVFLMRAMEQFDNYSRKLRAQLGSTLTIQEFNVEMEKLEALRDDDFARELAREKTVKGIAPILPGHE